MSVFPASPIASVDFELDRGAVIRVVDDHVFEVFGYRPAELVGQTFFSLVHPDDLVRVIGYFRESSSGEVAHGEGFARLRHRDGTTVVVNGTGITKPTRQGEFWVHLRIDVWDGEAPSLRDSRLSRVARGVAHDLNNLLGFLNQQAAGAGDRAQLAAICSALEAAHGLARSLDAAAEGEAMPVVTDLNEAVRQLLPALRAMVAGTLEVIADLQPAALPVPLAASDLHQILLNLLTNAREATATRGTARIGTRLHDGRVCLTVENRGDLRSTLPAGVMVVRPLPPTGSRGVGLITVASLVGRTGGRLEVEQSDATSTTIVATFGCRCEAPGL